MKTHPWSEIRKQLQSDPVRLARIQTMTRAMTTVHRLALLLDDEQRWLLEAENPLKASDPRGIGIEHQEDVYLSTLRDGITALGGRLDIRAIFLDEVIELVPSEQAT